MDDKVRCQSCGMGLSKEFGVNGSEKDGSFSETYCKICYNDGEFINPDQTLEEMIASSIENMTGPEVGMDVEKATEVANSFIPTLARWR